MKMWVDPNQERPDESWNLVVDYPDAALILIKSDIWPQVTEISFEFDYGPNHASGLSIAENIVSLGFALGIWPSTITCHSDKMLYRFYINQSIQPLHFLRPLCYTPKPEESLSHIISRALGFPSIEKVKSWIDNGLVLINGLPKTLDEVSDYSFKYIRANGYHIHTGGVRE